MKKFWIYILSIIIFMIGWICNAMYFVIRGFEWFHIPLLIASCLIITPALMWWQDYFAKIFEVDEK